ncbi:unnamed protein product [Spirodela intermedia]|uniref:Uncharacterized protein n=1 Tax=Spirodela intermedia TaxID=51605 RepID=A0A7I8K244_SPIIN|nr:unnamed protein product [Spirodela intermedia]
MGAEEESVEQAAAARRERLRALRAAKELLSTPDEESAAAAGNVSDRRVLVQKETGDGDDREGDLDEPNGKRMNVKFRNYVPLDKRLQEHKLAPPALPKFEDPVAPVAEPEKIEDPFVNIAPKKPNWDLRRDVQKRLDKLERRTQKALYELYMEQEERHVLEGNGELPPQD